MADTTSVPRCLALDPILHLVCVTVSISLTLRVPDRNSCIFSLRCASACDFEAVRWVSQLIMTSVTATAASPDLVFKKESLHLRRVTGDLPPTPPESIHNDCEKPTSADYPLPPASTAPTKVLDVDKKTPDGWLPRDPRLIRLTGVHPFNVEPPLSDLYNDGFLTSPELFYVRNHGAVPHVTEEEVPDWEFSIEGYACLGISLLGPLMSRLSDWSKTRSGLRSNSSSRTTIMSHTLSPWCARATEGKSRMWFERPKASPGAQQVCRPPFGLECRCWR